MKYPDFKVCVRCFTYNQSKYVTETLDGFCMQKTNFPFVCCVVDDDSTDGEQEIIRKYVQDNFKPECRKRYETDYAEVFYAQHKTNENCFFAVLYLKENLYSKKESFKKWQYISEWRDICDFEAICEGDDYWIDSQKLQKQVDFLESNSSFGMVGTGFVYYYQKSGKKVVCIPSNNKLDFKEVLVKGGIGTTTCSVLYRLSYVSGFQNFVSNNNWPLGDLPLWLYILRNSQIYFTNDITSVYRHLPESASHTKSYSKAVAFNQGILDIQLFFAEAYDKTMIPAVKAKSNQRMFYTAIQHGNTNDAIKFAKKIHLSPLDCLKIIKCIIKRN